MMEQRAYQPGDEQAILDLFELSFKKKLSMDYWQWRFAKNPCGHVMIQLMWENDLLVGHYAVSPVILNVQGQRMLSALSMTTMTHPDHAGKGIFTALAESLYQRAAKEYGLQLVWGFPNTNSHYGFVKNLQWTDLEQIPSFSLDLHRFPFSGETGFNTIKAFSAEHATAASSLLKKSDWAVERSAEYLNWRYVQNPSNNYSIVEMEQEGMRFFAVFKKFPSFSEKGKWEVDILEMQLPSDLSLLKGLLNSIVQVLAEKDLIRINCWMSVHDPKHILLEKIGFVNQAPITYAGHRMLHPETKQLQASAWNYSMGDSDVF